MKHAMVDLLDDDGGGLALVWAHDTVAGSSKVVDSQCTGRFRVANAAVQFCGPSIPGWRKVDYPSIDHGQPLALSGGESEQGCQWAMG